MKTQLMALLCAFLFVFVGCSKNSLRTQQAGVFAAGGSEPGISQSAETTPASSSSPYQGLWWNPSESGWGMTLTQHNSSIFVAMYTYDSAGNPDWYTIPNCPVVTSGCSGSIYHVTGGSAPTSPWQGQNRVVTEVGSGTLSFSNTNHAVFNFNIHGIAGSKTIEKEIFTNVANQGTDYTDMWWNESESGWGATITHEGNVMFIAMYTYDQSGNPVWYVASNCNVTNNNTCTGALYKTAGGKPLTSSWNASTIAVTAVGSISFNFSNSDHASMTYTIDGVSGSKVISRMAFGGVSIPEAPVPGINYPVTIVTEPFVGTFNSYNDFATRASNVGSTGACIKVDDIVAYGQNNFPPCIHLATAHPVTPTPTPTPVPTCTGSQPADEIRNLSCAEGHIGAIVQKRIFTCIGTVWTPGEWIQTANSCVTTGAPISCSPSIHANGSFAGNGNKDVSIARGGFVSYGLPLYPAANRVLEILSIESTSSEADIPDEFSISTCPGDFDVSPECKVFGSVDQSATQLYAKTSLAPIAGTCTLLLGQQYYINVRMVRPDGVTPGCSVSSCSMILQLNSYMQ